jgi:hypothetical protein
MRNNTLIIMIVSRRGFQAAPLFPTEWEPPRTAIVP